MASGKVEAVHASSGHTLRKQTRDNVTLIADHGVEGDAHAGATVKHRSRVAKDPEQPNLRQVHLIHGELHDELRSKGFAVEAGAMGENVTTRGVALLDLPTGARLRLGEHAVVEITGLRTPCKQLETIQDGLMSELMPRAEDGAVLRKAGVMAVVVSGGAVRAGDAITVELPAEPHRPLQPV
jgi:MOSC domain-containing protein YiiM